MWDGQMTVAELLQKINEMVAKDPQLLNCGVCHVECGGITPSFNIAIDEFDDSKCITLS